MTSRRLRVLHVGKFYPPHLGGMETHLELLCEGLHRHCDINAIVANDGRRTTSDFVGNVPIIRVGTLGYVAGTPVCPNMVQAIRAHPADIIHIHWPNPTAVVS